MSVMARARIDAVPAQDAFHVALRAAGVRARLERRTSATAARSAPHQRASRIFCAQTGMTVPGPKTPATPAW